MKNESRKESRRKSSRQSSRQSIAEGFFLHSLLLITSLSISWQAMAEQFDLSDTPLFTLAGVNPNIVLTMDDSGSMAWSFMPTSIGDHRSTKRAKSSTFNKIYYDPEILYDPPVDEDGVSLGNASFTAAWDDGFNKAGSGSCTKNLSTSYRPSWGGINPVSYTHLTLPTNREV